MWAPEWSSATEHLNIHISKAGQRTVGCADMQGETIILKIMYGNVLSLRDAVDTIY